MYCTGNKALSKKKINNDSHWSSQLIHFNHNACQVAQVHYEKALEKAVEEGKIIKIKSEDKDDEDAPQVSIVVVNNCHICHKT